MEVRVDVEGLDQLVDDLGRVEAKAAHAVSRAVRKAALDVQRDAKVIVPVDTGFLRSTIGVDLGPRSDAGPRVHGPTEYTAEIGPTAHYGGYVEWGTSRMAPQPYMAPALDRQTPAFIAACEDIADRLLGGD